MPPSAFARWPLNWLEAISEHRGTVTAGPDSAYARCVEKTTAEQRARLDLSSLRVAVNGSEPVSSATLEAFSEAFAGSGFRADAWFVTYGLAESTLMATAPQAGTGPTRLPVEATALRAGRVQPGADRVLVGCGRAHMHRGVEIVDPATERRLAPGEVGEIWLSGPDVARGYWPLWEHAQPSFCGRIDGGGDERFLRTGDLGVMHDGELFVAGRIKDVIIIGGRNHYPQDFESTAVAVDEALVAGACVAFGVERGGRERLVIVAGVAAAAVRCGVDLEAVALAIRTAIATEHGVAVAEVVLVDRKAVPRTSSGKIQRRACCAAFERGELESAVSCGPDGHPLPPPTIEQRRQLLYGLITGRIAEILRLGPGGVDTTLPFQQLGLDSLTTAELREQLGAALGEQLPATAFFAHPTTERLVEGLLDHLAPRAPHSGGDRDELDELDEPALAAALGEELGRLDGVLQR
jgi:acyl-CoA synthetase (AMP-forming)/AMP-acid ligase II/acyl carrier protein